VLPRICHAPTGRHDRSSGSQELLLGAQLSLAWAPATHLQLLASVEVDEAVTKRVGTAERTIGTRSQPAEASGVASLSHRFRFGFSRRSTRAWIPTACAHRMRCRRGVDLAHAHAARLGSCGRTSHPPGAQAVSWAPASNRPEWARRRRAASANPDRKVAAFRAGVSISAETCFTPR
jgi:hypothetical protein